MVESLIYVNFYASILIIIVLIMRFAGYQILPKNLFATLWKIIVLRLIFLLEIPIYVTGTKNIKLLETQMNMVTSVIPIKEMYVVDNYSSIFSYVRIVVTLGMVSCVCIMYIYSYFRLSDALPVKKDAFIVEWLSKNRGIRPIAVKQSDRVFTPLTYGNFFPKIILPKCLQCECKKDLEYILLHEKIHIMRLDNMWKFLSFITICIHWFNPFVWLLHYMFVRDIENACDEKVISVLGEDKRKEYAEILINMSQQKLKLYTTSTCFGYKVIQERIVTIMKYKKSSCKNKLCAVLLVLLFSLATSFTAFAAEERADVKVIKSVSEENLLNGTYKAGWFQKSVKKTVKKNYVTETDIPASIYYSEYIDGAWYVGTLDATGEVDVLSTGLYQATFSGKIYKQ
ncbi:MAG: M56 family metallopeptidase [Lachnospiraceae bacterium]|nr:M56 family metallopeptidase [Lachnospiraceae bacterium]